MQTLELISQTEPTTTPFAAQTTNGYVSVVEPAPAVMAEQAADVLVVSGQELAPPEDSAAKAYALAAFFSSLLLAGVVGLFAPALLDRAVVHRGPLFVVGYLVLIAVVVAVNLLGFRLFRRRVLAS